MGCSESKDGVSIQFYDANGEPDGAPFYGRYCRLFGSPRREVATDGLTPIEEANPGSEDWITLIGVADTQQKLAQIVSEWNGGCKPCYTSCSSHRVSLDIHLGGIRQQFKNRTTIASGPFASLEKDTFKINVVHVKVFPEGVQLEKLATDDLHHEFKASSPFKTIRKLSGLDDEAT